MPISGNAPYFNILRCLMLDDFTCQGGGGGVLPLNELTVPDWLKKLNCLALARAIVELISHFAKKCVNLN